MAQGVKSIIFNNNYKIYHVKYPWFWFWLVFAPYTAWAVFCGMDETLDVCLPPWFAISNSPLQGDSLKKFQLLLKSYKTLFNSKWMWSYMCQICNKTARKLTEESAFMGLPSHYSIHFPHLKYQMKTFWSKASVMYEQLLSSVPYAMLCPIHNTMFMFFVY